MTAAAVFDAGLAALTIAVGAWIIAVRDTFAAVVSFVAYGLLLSLAWVQLSAVDVALTEAAIGGGATGMLLLVAAARLRSAGSDNTAKRPGPALRIMAASLCALVFAGLAALVLFPANPAPTLAPEAAAPMAALGLGNPVTAVLLAYRSFDTLLEGVVLLLALVGVWSITPDRAWGGAPDLRDRGLTGDVVRLSAQLLAPVGIVVAIYVFWSGATAPGGKFQAGTILAAMWVLVMMAGLRDAPAIRRRSLRLALVIGPAVFLLVGLLGFATEGVFLAYPPGLAKPLILIIEAAMMISIAATLGLLVAGPPTHPPRP